MMVYVNITFLCAHDETTERIAVLKGETIPALCSDSEIQWRLMQVVDVLGNPDFKEQDTSLPLQFAFGSHSDRIDWINKIMMPALQAYSNRFGEKGLVMVSLLDDVAVSAK